MNQYNSDNDMKKRIRNLIQGVTETIEKGDWTEKLRELFRLDRLFSSGGFFGRYRKGDIIDVEAEEIPYVDTKHSRTDKQGRAFSSGHQAESVTGTSMIEAGQISRLPGKYSSIIERIVGVCGSLVFGGLMLGFGLAGLGVHLLGSGAMLASGLVVTLESIFTPFLVASLGLLGHGTMVSSRVKRIENYLSQWKGKSFVMLDKLASDTGVSMKQIKKDISFLMQNQLFTFAKYDESKTCLLFTREAVKQSEEANQARKERESVEKLAEEQAAEEVAADFYGEEAGFYEFQKNAGRIYEQLSGYRLRISDEGIKTKLHNMMDSYTRLLGLVNEHHELYHRTERMVDLYMPDMTSLLEVYSGMEDRETDSDHVRRIKEEVGNALNMIQEALDGIMADLYSNTAMEVTADVRVLEMLLKREGWIQ